MSDFSPRHHGDENRPDAEELEYLRAGLSRWREQVATARAALATA